MENPGFGQEIFIFSKMSILAMGSNQLLIQYVPGDFSLGGKVADGV
jgi:hypothetical protein